MFRLHDRNGATEGLNRCSLREKLQEFANEYGVPAHCAADDAAAIVLANFIRTLNGALDLLRLKCVKTEP